MSVVGGDMYVCCVVCVVVWCRVLVVCFYVDICCVFCVLSLLLIWGSVHDSEAPTG